MSIKIVEVSPDSPDAVQLIGELDVHLRAHPYPEQSRHAFSVEKLVREGVTFFITHYHDELAGCGGIKIFPNEYGEVKRMWVRPDFRRLGLGKGMLKHLAEYAQSRELSLLRLETGIYETAAIGLYERFGFQRRAPFGEYKEDPMSVYFEKSL
ncbi:MAG TPA: GNAT family N-acetyltransferase [Pyrinomonadaceae bacterium]